MFSPRSIGAFFLAALQALNISARSAYVESPGYELVDYLTNPYGIVDNTFNFVFGDDRIETDNEFLERSTIRIDKDITYIDGVPYTNVWLSHDAAEQFRTEGHDLKTAFAIASNSSGQFVSGEGFVMGCPVYNVGNNNVRSPQYRATVPNQLYEAENNRFYFQRTATVGGYYYDLFVKPRFQETYRNYPNIWQTVERPTMFRIYSTDGGSSFSYIYGILQPNLNIDPSMVGGIPHTELDMTPFDFDWQAEEIPADAVLGTNVGLNIQVPTQTINNFYITYPQYDQPSVEIPMVDVDSSLIDDLILPLIPVINTGDANIEFTEHETPTPTPGTIANEPWESLRRALQNIQESIQQGTTIQQAIKAGQDIIAQLIAPINTTLTTIQNSISDLIDKIETGSIDFFRDTIRSIRVPFQRWFGLLAQNLGIWHYVVEWLQYISAPFSWFWNVFSNVNPILISPVYAMFAATLVIAIYRRFGR